MAQPLRFPTRPASRRRLEKEIAPATPLGLSAMGLNLQPKDDAVLVYLAMSDEREYQKLIRTDTAISGAIEQRVTGLMRAGDEVVEGPSGSKAAGTLKDFAVWLLKGIPRFQTLRREVLHAIYFGWRPVELQWTGERAFEGQPMWSVARAVARKPWHYHFTDKDELALTVGTETLVYDQEEDRLRFMIARAGTTDSPYGEAWLQRIWLLYFLSKQFEKMSAQAMQRALGVLKLVRKGGGSSSLVTPQTIARADLDSEVKTIIQRLNAHNIAAETQSYALEVLSQPELANNITGILDYFNVQKRIAIVGQNLTSEVKGGSFAAEQGHGEILENFFHADAREEADWWNDGLLKPAIQLNFGEVDEMDMPRWQSKLLSRPNLEATRQMFDMGAALDGGRLAHAFNVPLAPKEPGEDDVVLKKSEPLALALAPMVGDEEDDEPSPRPRPSLPRPDTKARTAADDLDRKIDREGDQAVREVSDELQRFYGGLARQFLAENPDPKE